MPIKKRLNAPVQGTAREGAKYRTGVSIDSLIRKYDRLASDAEWSNEPITAEKHRAKAAEYRARREAGEVYT